MKTKTAHLLFLAALVVAATLHSGCGDDSRKKTAAPTAPQTTTPAAGGVTNSAKTSSAPTPPAIPAATVAPKVRVSANVAGAVWREGDVFSAVVSLENNTSADLAAIVKADLSGASMSNSKTKKTFLKSGEKKRIFTFYTPEDDGVFTASGLRAERAQLNVSVATEAGEELDKTTRDVFIYPLYDDAELADALRGVRIATSPTPEVLADLAAGKPVLLLADAAAPPTFSLSGEAKSSLKADIAHTRPLFENFPTDATSGEQWARLLSFASVVAVANLPVKISPLVTFNPKTALDNKNANKLVIGESVTVADAGKITGKLLVCGISEKVLRAHPEGRHLLACMAAYLCR
ncbi:MAG: hypothetical protein LBT53_02630 [Puniceicoccales bacterium]|nr:hypothetical protein [Puniceicoccales bacterium]